MTSRPPSRQAKAHQNGATEWALPAFDTDAKLSAGEDVSLHPQASPPVPLKAAELSSHTEEAGPEASEDPVTSSPSVHSPIQHSRANSECSSYETNASSLPALQTNGQTAEGDGLLPLCGEDVEPGSYLLVTPPEHPPNQYSLETRSEQLFSAEHLRLLFEDTSELLQFTAFLSAHRPASVPILIYYLDAAKALKAVLYANAIAEALDPIPGYDFTTDAARPTINSTLEDKARRAFNVLVENDLPAYITHTYIHTVSLSIMRRITGTLPHHLREASEGLAEVFCLTDPSRADNPIVFASEEFHRTTQYGMNYYQEVDGENHCWPRALRSFPQLVRDISKQRAVIEDEKLTLVLDSRRDGSPFMNLLMVAPLCDSRGKVRYFIGAQVDVSGLVRECSDFPSLKRLVASVERATEGNTEQLKDERKDEFQELSEMFNKQELETVRRWGGRMHKEQREELHHVSGGSAETLNRPRLLLSDSSPELSPTFESSRRLGGRLSGVYENYLLVRPYPSLKILFASPSLRVPGILQSPFMAKIGGSTRVREELSHALADGRGVTAKVRWVSRYNLEGRSRWIHCTPLIGSNGAIGVWMIVIVDDEQRVSSRKARQAPPVGAKSGQGIATRDFETESIGESIGGYARDSGSERLSTSHTDSFVLRSGTPDLANPG
ncbi:MAG: hypothetical protein M1818_005555 [Claussenomyces sp. TS43310]|nr:MAG: hypothetical protein M1818_005555 [Claussenomyces sp. TS43310]